LLLVVSGVGYLAAAGPASAAGPWWVATSGSTAAACPGTQAQPCATVSLVIAKGAFVDGDTINVQPGTYTDKPLFTSKGANVVGQGAGATFSGQNTSFAMGSILSGKTLKLTNLTLTAGKNANGLGGGLAIANPGTVIATNVTLTGNNASNQGGGAYVGSGSTLTMTGGSITNNTATAGAANQGWGGGVYVAGTLTLDGVTVSGNKAVGGAFGTSGEGGGVMSLGATTIKNSTFTDNQASGTGSNAGFGGGVYSLGSSLTISDTTISGTGAQNAVAGGGIAYGSAVTANRVTVSGNKALLAGGVYAAANGTFNDSTISGNAATHASVGLGGGVFSAAGTLTLDHTTVGTNQAAVSGGGAYVSTGLTAEIRNGSSLTGNSAVSGGGLLNAGTTTVRASHVDHNSAAFVGGGAYTTGPLNVVDNSTVDNNTAAFIGGGLSTGTTGTSPNQVPAGSISVTGGHLNGNSAYGAGGAYVGDGLRGSFDGTTFDENTATSSGGGALFNSGTTTVSRSTFTHNHAVRIGADTQGNLTGIAAAIYSGTNSDNVTTKLTVRSSTIAENDGWAASALLTLSGGSGDTNTASIDNSTIHGNTSSSQYGAIEALHPLTVIGSTITDNTAASGGWGGLVETSNGLIGVAGSILSGNVPAGCPGTVNDGGYNLTGAAEPGCGFTAAKQDVTGNPLLGALAGNGGPTSTQLPGPASPALDTIPAPTPTGLSDAVSGSAITLCAAGAQDQRGTARPQGAKCDIGSVEADQVVPTVDGPATATYVVGVAGGPQTYTTTGSPQATLSASGLPAGLGFHDNGNGTGTISGTPASGTGGTHHVVVSATNEKGTGTKDVTITVNEAASLSGPSSDTYTVGQPGGPDTFSQTGGFPVATLSGLGTPPGGVGFTDHGNGTGDWGGTPTAGSGGVYHLGVKASNGTPPDATVDFLLTVKEAPALTGPSSATFTVGTAGASGAFTATGFPVPSLSATGLPSGLSLTGTGSGSIAGTPANGTGGEYDATAIASNGVGADATLPVHVVVKEAPELVGPSAARFVVGSDRTIAFSSDGYPVAAISLTGSLPAGLAFHAFANGTATIGGTATTVGTYHVTLTASNGVSPDSVVNLTIDVVPPLAISTTSLPSAAYHTAYSANLAAIGGQPPYAWSLVAGSGTLPPGLTLNANGMITGSPAVSSGTYTFKVQVTDAADPAQSDTRQLSITIGKGPTSLVVDPVVIQKSGLNIKLGIVSATLTGGFPPVGVAGQTIVFKAGTTTVCTGTTDVNGRVARCEMTLLNTLKVVNNGGVSATYAGNTFWLPSSGSAGLVG
jgi:hypothetical protein